jgi:signal transduction histidine kinase
MTVSAHEPLHTDSRRRALFVTASERLQELGGSIDGVVVERVRSLEQAIERMRDADQARSPYGVGFFDEDALPGTNLLEAVRWARSIDPGIELVICTSEAAKISRELDPKKELLILKKPFELSELCHLTRTLSERSAKSSKARRKINHLKRSLRQRLLDLESAYRQLRATPGRGYTQGELLHKQRLETIGKLSPGLAHEISTSMQYVGTSVHFLNDAIKDLSAAVTTYQCLLEENGQQPQVPSSSGLQSGPQSQKGYVDLPFILESAPQAIAHAQLGVERVTAMIQAMRSFSQPTHEERESVDVNACLRDIVALTRNEWKHVAEVVLNLDPELPELLAWRAELQQVFLHIFLNAVQAVAQLAHSGERRLGQILIASHAEQGHLVVDISDAGQELETASQRLEPLSSSEREARLGSYGLGALYASVLERHAAAVTCDVGEGANTVVHVLLPLWVRDAEQRSYLPEGSN